MAAVTLAEIDDAIARLQRSLMTGTILQSLSVGPIQLSFRTFADMEKGLDILRRERSRIAGGGVRLASTSKGTR